MDTQNHNPTSLLSSILCWGFYVIGKFLEDYDTVIFHSLQYASFAISITVGLITIFRFFREYIKKKKIK